MSTERWQQLERIFAEGRQLPVDARAEFVARACGADEMLQREALSLLTADDAPNEFLAKPALGPQAGVLGALALAESA